MKLPRSYSLLAPTLDLLGDHLESGAEAEDMEWLKSDIAGARKYLVEAFEECPLNSPAVKFLEDIAGEINCAETGEGTVTDRAGDFFAAFNIYNDMLAELDRSSAYRKAVDEWDRWQREMSGRD